jgi:Restriction endonuclease S subunits
VCRGLGKFPEHWRVIHLKRISPQITVGIVITPSKYYVDEGVPCLRSLNIKENYILNEDLVYISEESNLLHSKSKIYKGDLVSVRTGQTGTTTVVNENFNGCNCIDLIIIRKSNDFDSDYLSYVLNSDLAKTKYSLESAGSIQSHFNIEMASNMIIPLPPLEEQILIRKYIVTKAQNIEKTYRKISESISLIQEYRSTLISAAVTGKIDVRDEATA